MTSVVAPVVPFAARRDATVKWKRSSTYALHYYFDCCFRHGSCAPLSSWIPLARLFEIEQPCRGSCQNSSSPVKTSVFPSKQRTPSPTSPFPFFRKLFHFFFLFFLFFHRYPSRPLIRIRFNGQRLAKIINYFFLLFVISRFNFIHV